MNIRSILAGVAIVAASTLGASAQQPDWLPTELKKPMNELVIGFANLGPGVNAYAATYLNVFTDYAEELGIKTIILDSQADPVRQASQVQDLIAQQVDAMVVWPVNGKAIVPVVKQAHDAGIPVVITNSNIDPSGKDYIAAYTGPDDWTEANLAGKMMVEALGGKGNVVMLNGIPGYSVTQLRIDGFMDAIKDHPEIKILDSQPANFSQEKAQALMENYITRFGKDINGVFSVDSGVGAGALAAVKAAEQEGKLEPGQIKFTDATIFQAVYDAIKAGDYYGSVVQSPEDDAKTALKTAVQVAQGAEVPKEVYLEMPIVTSKTIDSIKRPAF